MSTKNDKAWEKIFSSSLNPLERIKEEGSFYITADQIKEYGKREPRLITKIDHSRDAPKVFKKENLSILPTKRGEYVIGPFKTHEKLEYDESKIDIHWVDFPSYIKSINPRDITSESIALNAAHLSGMIEDFVGEPVFLTVNGRMSSKSFDFYIEGHDEREQRISVERSQVEIDGGYEGEHQLVLIEAKNRIPEDFLVRQLYYPYALWKRNLADKKIVPVFFTYVDNIFSFFQYEFEDDNIYNSLELVKVKHYSLNLSDRVTKEEIQSYLQDYEDYNEESKSIPFPQADNFLRILDCIKNLEYITSSLLGEEEYERKIPKSPRANDIAQFYGMAPRQGDYYGNALAYLEIVERKNGRYSFTELGREIHSAEVNERIRMIIQSILKRPVFRKSFNYYITEGEIKIDFIISLMKKYVKTVPSEVTRRRRAQTVKSWIEWLKEYYN